MTGTYWKFQSFFLILFAESNDNELWGKALPQVAPSENECRPYIEKAIKKLTTDGATGKHKSILSHVQLFQRNVGVVERTYKLFQGASILVSMKSFFQYHVEI